MKKIAAAALAGMMLATTPTYAADLFGTAAPPMSLPAGNGPTAEVGSNWYIRGDVGVSIENSPTVQAYGSLIPDILYDTGVGGTGAAYVNAPPGDASHPAPVTRGNNRTSQNGDFDIGGGYRVNDYIRLEATYNFWRGPGLGTSKNTLCPETATAVSNTTVTAGVPTAVPYGYLWAPASCNGYVSATQYNNMGLASAYVDLGSYWGFTPYIGAGAGINANTITGTSSFYNSNDGSAARGDTTASGAAPLQWVTLCQSTNQYANYCALKSQPNVTFGQQNFNRSFSSTKYSVAGALMAGFGYQLSPSATLDIGYRYIAPDLFGSIKNSVQQLNVGIRYMAD